MQGLCKKIVLFLLPAVMLSGWAGDLAPVRAQSYGEDCYFAGNGDFICKVNPQHGAQQPDKLPTYTPPQSGASSGRPSTGGSLTGGSSVPAPVLTRALRDGLSKARTQAASALATPASCTLKEPSGPR